MIDREKERERERDEERERETRDTWNGEKTVGGRKRGGVGRKRRSFAARNRNGRRNERTISAKDFECRTIGYYRSSFRARILACRWGVITVIANYMNKFMEMDTDRNCTRDVVWTS